MARELSKGSTGQEVRDLQMALNARPPSSLPPLAADGIFGAKTEARVREFQRAKGLTVDGIVGPRTWSAIVGPSLRRGCDCCQPESPAGAAFYGASAPKRRIGAGASSFRNVSAVTEGSDGDDWEPPTQRLTADQRATAREVYGDSLDFSLILISSKAGLQNRPFTYAFPFTTGIMQIINCGTFNPNRATLIHELCHVWQSQHHSNKFKFMANAVESQGRAAAANAAAVFSDPSIRHNDDFPLFYPFDSYASDASLSFSDLAAEQMASAVEHGRSAIVNHIRSIAANAIDPALVTALASPRMGDRRLPNVS